MTKNQPCLTLGVRHGWVMCNLTVFLWTFIGHLGVKLLASFLVIKSLFVTLLTIAFILFYCSIALAVFCQLPSYVGECDKWYQIFKLKHYYIVSLKIMDK